MLTGGNSNDTHTHTHTCTHAHTHTHTHTHKYTHKHTQAHTDAHVRMHARTHRHTQLHEHSIVVVDEPKLYLETSPSNNYIKSDTVRQSNCPENKCRAWLAMVTHQIYFQIKCHYYSGGHKDRNKLTTIVEATNNKFTCGGLFSGYVNQFTSLMEYQN